LFGYAPVLFAATGLTGSQVFVQAGDLLLVSGVNFDRRDGPLAQPSGPLDRRARIG
jgi:hypothetical protein